MLFIALAGVVIFALLVTSGDEKSEASSFDAPSWAKQIEGGVTPSTSSSASGDAGDDAIVAFYKAHGHLPPPEYPAKVGDLGEHGDLDAMDDEDALVAARVLYEEDDVAKLVAFALALEENGFDVAANRFRQKALRIVDSSNQPLLPAHDDSAMTAEMES